MVEPKENNQWIPSTRSYLFTENTIKPVSKLCPCDSHFTDLVTLWVVILPLLAIMTLSCLTSSIGKLNLLSVLPESTNINTSCWLILVVKRIVLCPWDPLSSRMDRTSEGSSFSNSTTFRCSRQSWKTSATYTLVSPFDSKEASTTSLYIWDLRHIWPSVYLEAHQKYGPFFLRSSNLFYERDLIGAL